MKPKFFGYAERVVLAFVQRVVISYTYFIRNELRNHAAAAAYYMLLSLIPMVLLMFYVFDNFLSRYQEFSDELFYILSTFSDSLSPQMFKELGISGKVGGAIGIVGALNLVWSSRLILVSLQRAFFVIFPSDKKRNFIVENGMAFILLPLVFILVLLMTVFSSVKGFLMEYLTFFNIIGPYLIKMIWMLSAVVSGLIGFGLVFLSFKFIPVKKADNMSVFKGTVLFLVLYTAVKFAAFRLFHVFSINTAYGMVGSLIVLLAWAYFVFMIYLFCAQFVFVCYRADILILNMLFSAEKPTKAFMRMNRDLLLRYTREIKADEILVRQHEVSFDIYYILDGKFSVNINGNDVGEVNEGEVFGEMAHITGESRSATLTAASDSHVIVLTPAEFDDIVEESPMLNRRIMRALCSRLKHSNESYNTADDLD